MVSKEWIALATFGEIEKKRKLREMAEVNVLRTRNRDRMKIEALVVPEISQVKNEHIEVVKED